ncbi:rhodanese-like domain-containing protein [Halovivax limisalsi]|uniref:rhodanese-like domain-containing protein n=1 Tax=Halovivax limisalsi TaxID=1453760 RepID=UPI001FFCCE4F|nr:rhodanese-like domain-containing protein [Halovivax limisalsi]
MNRRRFLALSVVGSSTVLAGCLGDESDDTESSDPGATAPATDGADDDTDDVESPSDGAESSDSTDETGSTDDSDDGSAEGEYETITVDGHEIPLVPVETAHDWYEADGTYFLDARSEVAYENSHIEGARLSPAGRPNFDHPTDDIPLDARIVTYCGCPHHLSSARAAELYDAGYTDVYAIDEGFGGWTDEGYPTVEGSTQQAVRSYTIRGRTDDDFAGEQVWLVDAESGQQYVSEIGADGSFKLSFEFVAVDDDTVVTLELPDRTLERTLGELSASPIEL